jgi:hypothetical protein
MHIYLTLSALSHSLDNSSSSCIRELQLIAQLLVEVCSKLERITQHQGIWRVRNYQSSLFSTSNSSLNGVVLHIQISYTTRSRNRKRINERRISSDRH